MPHILRLLCDFHVFKKDVNKTNKSNTMTHYYTFIKEPEVMVALYRFISYIRCTAFQFLKILILLNYKLWIKTL